MHLCQDQVYCWSERMVPYGSYDNVSSLIWYQPEKPDTEDLATRILRRENPSHRALFFRHLEKHDPSAWKGSQVDRLVKGAGSREGYSLCVKVFSTLLRNRVESLPLIVTEYEGLGGVGYYQFTERMGVAPTVQWLAEQQAEGAFPDGHPLASLDVSQAMGIGHHTTNIVRVWEQVVQDRVNEWIRDTVVRAYEDVFGLPCPLSQYGTQAVPLTTKNENAHRTAVGAPSFIDSPRMYLDGKSTPDRKAEIYAAELDAYPKDRVLGPWLSPIFAGNSNYRLPISADFTLLNAVRRNANFALFWSGLSNPNTRPKTLFTDVQTEQIGVLAIARELSDRRAAA